MRPSALLTLVCCLFGSPTLAETVGYWRFEPDALLADSSPHGLTLLPVGQGIKNGPATLAAVPATGLSDAGSAAYTGAGAVRIPCDGTGPLAATDGQDFTFECWLTTGPSIGVQVLLSKVHPDPDAPGTRSHGFDFMTWPGRAPGDGTPLCFRIYTNADALLLPIIIGGALQPNTTYHLALTRDGMTYRVFINGILRATADSKATIAGDGDWFIGTLGCGDQPFGGHNLSNGCRVDEARFSDRALKPNELLLFPQPGQLVERVSLAPQSADGWSAPSVIEPAEAKQLGDARDGLTRVCIDTIPGVYHVRFCCTEPTPRHRDFDVAVNGTVAAQHVDPAKPGAPESYTCQQVVCVDGRVELEFMARTPAGAVLSTIELLAAQGTLPAVLPPPVAVEGSGWEVPLPTRDSLIPDPVKLEVELRTEPNACAQPPYVPSQNLAADPNRLNAQTRGTVAGITSLAPDRQAPLPRGIRFLNPRSGYFEIHHRRAGCRCDSGARFSLRMERFTPLAYLALAVGEGDTVVPLDSFEAIEMAVRPGHVTYRLKHEQLGLEVEVEAVTPAAVPVYGVLVKVGLRNLRPEARQLTLYALAGPNRSLPSQPSSAAPVKSDRLVIEAPRGNPLQRDKQPLLLHDTNYQVLVGLSGQMQVRGKDTVETPLELPANGQADGYLTAVIDSPGYDAVTVKERLDDYFGRNQNLSEETRRQLTAEAFDTWVGIVTSGDQRYAKLRGGAAEAFERCAASCENGLYRTKAAYFSLPSPALQALANLVAGDLFPGIVQPPGLVHDAKYGDTWHYIFCYRHVHAASDMGLEQAAIGYLRLLSCNQQENGRISSTMGNFKSAGHGTQFDASYVDALTHYYHWTGDLEAVRQLWPTIVKAMEYVDSSLDPDGDLLYRDTIHQWKSDFDSRGPSSSYQTAIVYRAYADLGELGAALGEPDATKYADKAKAIRAKAQAELWSNELAIMGPKGPSGVLRPHPQSLEAELPIWTGLVDPTQAAALAEWYLTNLGIHDEAGGLWMYDNDWWPVVWSQHMGSPGDSMMVAWALLQTGRFDEGTKLLETIGAASLRAPSPGLNYTWDQHGQQGGNDPATAQGALTRCLVEGVYGIEPHLERHEIVIRPSFPSDWSEASFGRPGVEYGWRREGGRQTITVKTAPDVSPVVELPVRSALTSARINGHEQVIKPLPGLRWARVSLRLPAGGGTAVVETEPVSWQVKAPEQAAPGEVIAVRTTGLDEVELDDPFAFLADAKVADGTVTGTLTKPGAGQAIVFLRCTTGGTTWLEPVVIRTMPATAAETIKRTVTDPLPDGTKLVPTDLSAAYNADIQSVFQHRWQWDANGSPGGQIRYWTMPLFDLRQPYVQRLKVKGIPFLLGPMGPGQAEQQPDLLLLANTAPHELPSGATLSIGRNLQKVYLLSLDMNLPQKCYMPAAEVLVHYTDGSSARTLLTPPLNFDAFYQDYAVNTVALPLPARPAYGMDGWVNYGGVDLAQHHLTMTDIVCDPAKTVESLEVRSLESETFIALAGVTLAVAQ